MSKKRLPKLRIREREKWLRNNYRDWEHFDFWHPEIAESNPNKKDRLTLIERMKEAGVISKTKDPKTVSLHPMMKRVKATVLNVMNEIGD